MPGSGKQAPEIQGQIKELLEAGFDPTTIHRKLKVGRSSIYRMKRCLQQHGTAYMPTELNKKNGRPKVLTAEQELEVRDWLRESKNRNRYLDDLVWLIHDRFGIVCSTTTMSKLKRKWIKVLECEETGQPLEDSIRAQVMETHPNLPILHGAPAPAPARSTAPAPEATMMPVPAASQPLASEAEGDVPPELPLPRLPSYHPPAPPPSQQSGQQTNLGSQTLPAHNSEQQIGQGLLPEHYSNLHHYSHHEPQRYPVHEASRYPQREPHLYDQHGVQSTSRMLHHQSQPPTDPQLESPYYSTLPYEQHISPQIEQQLRQYAQADASRAI